MRSDSKIKLNQIQIIELLNFLNRLNHMKPEKKFEFLHKLILFFRLDFIFFFILVCFSQYRLLDYYCHSKIKCVIHDSINVYFASCVYHPSFERGVNQYDMWAKQFIERNPNSVFKFVSHYYHPYVGKFIFNVSSKYGNYIALMDYFKYIIKDFLENTTLPWLIRTTEDTLVDVKLFEQYMRNISRKYSFNQVVIRSHVVHYCPQPECIFLHGGSGMLMSRKAAELYLKNLPAIESYHLKNIAFGDDVIFGYFTTLIHHPSYEIDDMNFLGSPFTNDEVAIALNRSWNLLPTCELEPEDMRQINKLIFWHSGRGDNYPGRFGLPEKYKYPDNIFYEVGPKIRLCKNVP